MEKVLPCLSVKRSRFIVENREKGKLFCGNNFPFFGRMGMLAAKIQVALFEHRYIIQMMK